MIRRVPTSSSMAIRLSRCRRDGSTGEGEVLRDADGRPRICEWCPKPIPARLPTGRRTGADATTCGVICRKRRHRFQRAVARGVPLRVTARRDAGRLAADPGRFAYADSPYPGLADYYPEGEEVDHAALIAFLERSISC